MALFALAVYLIRLLYVYTQAFCLVVFYQFLLSFHARKNKIKKAVFFGILLLLRYFFAKSSLFYRKGIQRKSSFNKIFSFKDN